MPSATQPQPPPGQDAPGNNAPSRQPEDSWPPSEADRDKVRKLCSEYLADMASAGRHSGRDQGMNAAGPQPDRSPGRSGLPPPGDKLTETESSRNPGSVTCSGRPRRKRTSTPARRDRERRQHRPAVAVSPPPEGHAEQPALVTAAFIEAVDRRFGPGHRDDAAVTAFFGDVRSRFPAPTPRSTRPRPNASSASARPRIHQRHRRPHHPAHRKTPAPLIVADERYSGEKLDRFLASARKLLDN